mmetsp:Transcript_13459/g.17003  ORF Transcript_13459/g.17003 Transcript_13459/m.17003 type:complete len:98 (+) Transcript_13459:291-584(+)
MSRIPANATTSNSNITKVDSFMLNIIGLAQNTPTTETKPNPNARGIMFHPNAPLAKRIGILPALRQQKNAALVPIYCVGDNFLTPSKYTFNIGPMEL